MLVQNYNNLLHKYNEIKINNFYTDMFDLF
jgi:hypothetical protein